MLDGGLFRGVVSRVAAMPGGVFGGDLLSHPVARAVPSALTGLASGFGMEPGVSPSLWPPKLYGGVRPGLGGPVGGGPVPAVAPEPHSGLECFVAPVVGVVVGKLSAY